MPSPDRKTVLTSTAILCVARNETPYTEEWLEYHFGLGIDRVYYVSTDTDFTSVEAYLEGLRCRSRVELFHFDDFRPGWQMRCYNTYFPRIEEDWVLVIDVDEFLYLQDFPGISEYIGSMAVDIGQVQFPWLILMSGVYSHPRVFDILGESRKHISDHVKSMVRRECSSGVGIHSHDTGRQLSCLSSGAVRPAGPRHGVLYDDPQYFDRHPFVLHFYSRGHLDVLCRILDHQFFNSKSGPLERERLSRYLLGAADWWNIPTRYMLMKFFASLPTADFRRPPPELDSRTDVRALERIFLENIGRIVDFDIADIESLEGAFELRYGLSRKLESQDLTAQCDLSDYLRCSTQLEYVDRLRESMKKSQR